MEFREMMRLGVKNLRVHKLRTLLTMLGVIFGVGAVISMMSIGEGARRSAIEQIKLLGTNNIRIRKLELTSNPDDAADSPSPGLSYLDACKIGEKLPTAVGWSALKFVEDPVFLGGNAPQGVKVVGVGEGYGELTNSRPARGRFISYLDVSTAERVCVLGSEVKRELFG